MNISIVRCDITNTAPNETIKIDAIFSLEIPIHGKTLTIYSHDLLFHIRIGKKVKMFENKYKLVRRTSRTGKRKGKKGKGKTDGLWQDTMEWKFSRRIIRIFCRNTTLSTRNR